MRIFLYSQREKPSFRCSKTHTQSQFTLDTCNYTGVQKFTVYRHGKESKKIWDINNTEQNKPHTQTRTKQS